MKTREKKNKTYEQNKRISKIIESAIVTFAVLLAIVAVHIRISDVPKLTETEVIRVHSGDTLWEIACTYYGDEVDLKKAIDEIEKINGISNSMIYEGDSLLIPVYSR